MSKYLTSFLPRSNHFCFYRVGLQSLVQFEQIPISKQLPKSAFEQRIQPPEKAPAYDPRGSLRPLFRDCMYAIVSAT